MPPVPHLAGDIEQHNGEASRVEVRSFIRSLERSKRMLSGEQKLTPKAVGERVVEVLARRGPLAQAEIIREVDSNSSQVSYAIKALAEQGIVRDTGEKVGTSHVYSLSGSTLVRPGD